MSRHTVTLTAPNGAKVRTVRSRRYFVVQFGEVTEEYVPPVDPFEGRGEWVKLDPPKVVASVIKRTDNRAVAEKEFYKGSRRVVLEVIPGSDPRVIFGQRAYDSLGR